MLVAVGLVSFGGLVLLVFGENQNLAVLAIASIVSASVLAVLLYAVIRPHAFMNILEKIVDQKRREAKALRPQADSLKRRAAARSGRRDFAAALRVPESRVNESTSQQIHLIAEIKKASPSAGVICENFDPVRIAREYEAAGASALSVLTDEKFFGGRLEFLQHIRDAVKLPLLRKDFIIDELQIHESVAAGADAILLIVAILDDAQLKRFLSLAKELRVAALVEVHDEAELDRALAVGAEIIGINNRDLKTFTVDLAATGRLAKKIPPGKLIVSESGIHSAADVARARAAGANAILVGESLMRSGNIAAKVKELMM